MLDRIRLMPQQIDLLCKLVEVERSVPDEKRGKFIVSSCIGRVSDTFMHPVGLQVVGCSQDVEILGQYGLVSIGTSSRGTMNFFVTPDGFLFYEHIKLQGPRAERVEEEMRAHLSSDDFKRVFPLAFEKWIQADSQLWSSDSREQLTTVGHLCREAMQDFADELMNVLAVPEPHPPKDKTVARLRKTFDTSPRRVSKTTRDFLDALIGYWGAVSDLAQRQEHGSQRDGGELLWEDARRLVFQTLVVFYEIQHTLCDRM